MGTISEIDPHKAELIKILKRLLRDAQDGKMNGAIILSEYEDRYEMEMPGVFSTAEEDLALIIGRLQIANNYFLQTSLFSALEIDDFA